MCQRSASSPVSPFAHFLPPSRIPNDRTGRAPARQPTTPSQTRPPSAGPISSGQYLAASIGSTDPRIARLPYRGLATRDKAERRTAIWTADRPRDTHPTHKHRNKRELSRTIDQTSHGQSCITRIAAWARLGKHRRALVWLSSSSRCAPSSRPRLADRTSTSINVSILRTAQVRSNGGMEQRTCARISTETYLALCAHAFAPFCHSAAIALDIMLTYLRA